MSISLLLIPAAFAIAAAVGGTGVVSAAALKPTDVAPESGGPVPVQVQTRMKDPTLLGTALADLGATQITANATEVSASIDGIELTMLKNEDDVWEAHLVEADGHEISNNEATALIARIDAAYALQVQRAVATRIRERADAAGFDLVSETREEDDTVTMVLNVKEYLS